MRAGIYHGTEPLCENQSTKEMDSTNPRWNEWLEFLYLKDIPRSAKICFSICSVSKRKNKKVKDNADNLLTCDYLFCKKNFYFTQNHTKLIFLPYGLTAVFIRWACIFPIFHAVVLLIASDQVANKTGLSNLSIFQETRWLVCSFLKSVSLALKVTVKCCKSNYLP